MALRSLALTALLTVTSLVPLPLAQAQLVEAAPAMCFNHDPQSAAADPRVPVPEDTSPDAPPVPQAQQCPGGAPRPPNYLEGGPVVIQLYNIPDRAAQPYVRIRCTSNCQEVAGNYYYAQWTGAPLIFPKDFNDTAPAGSPKGSNPIADRVPRYNGTWEATMMLGNADQLSRTFNVWLFDIFKSTDLTVMPGERHIFRPGGFEGGATIDLRIEGLDENENYVKTPSTPTCVPQGDAATRSFFCQWDIPKNESVRIARCGSRHVEDCYRVVITGSGTTKADETMYFRIAPADIKAIIRAGQARGTTSEEIERTTVVPLDIEFHYPGAALPNGPLFTASDLPPPPLGQQQALHVRVERSVTTSAVDGAQVIGDVSLHFNARIARWQGNWTVPRDLNLSEPALFRLKIPETRDNWGNRIPQMTLGNYTVAVAHLEPKLVKNVTHLERAEEGKFSFAIRYHNGSAFTDNENSTPLKGCFLRDAPAAPPPTSCGLNTTIASYEGGLWVFRVHYDREYTQLGPHHFVLVDDSGKDRWNNTVNGTRAGPYEVIPASPRVNFTTAMRGRDVAEIERGEHIGISAFIRYADGSPFNHTVRYAPNSAEASILNVTIIRRGQGDAIQQTDTVFLHERDTEQGLWAGTLDVSLDDSTSPLGRWTFELDAVDNVTIPNVNLTRFDRTVVAAPLRFTPVHLSSVQPQAGYTMSFSFRVHYPDGSPVPPDALRTTLLGQVHRFDAKNRTAYGDPLSPFLQPEYSSTADLWTLQYVVPGYLFNSSFVFVMSGVDGSGNRLPKDAYSRAFSPLSIVESREVLTQPPPTVRRGDAATVVFAAQDGDVGVDGVGTPVIRVERYDASADRWDPVVNGTNVRQPDADLRDHLGVFGVTTTTAIGTYRFVLLGREAAPSLAIITNISSNFTVESTQVTRSFYTLPPERVTKGEAFGLQFERHDGDRFSLVSVLLNGRASNVAKPSLVNEGTHVNMTWRIPFEAPSGNYTVHVEGRDQFGNEIVLDTPNIEAIAAELSGKILGNPQRAVARGTPATFLFGVTYPSGVFYSSTAIPDVYVYNTTGLVAPADVKHEGLTFQASWIPPASAEVVDYYFEVVSDGASGRGFPALRSTSFRLAPGEFDRSGVSPVPGTSERLTTLTWSVPVSEGDSDVGFELGYYGATTDISSVSSRDPTTLTPLPHTIEPLSGHYVARFVTDQQTPIGAYRIVMTAEDRVGNVIRATSNVFLIRPTVVIVNWDAFPPNDALGEGKTLTLSFVARYKNGPLLEENLGRPSAALLLDEQPTTQRPEVTLVNGRWQIRFTAPEILRDGSYTFVIGGSDIAGNSIATSRSTSYIIETPLSNSFAKVIPGPGPFLTVLAIAALALVMGTMRSQRRT